MNGIGRVLYITFWIWLLMLWTPFVCLGQEVRPVLSQDRADWELQFRELMGEEDSESVHWEQMLETLAEYAEHPLDINHATREELEAIPFLTPEQVEEILAYIYRYGEMQSPAELTMIESMDFRQRTLLFNFIYLGHEQPKNRFPRIDSIASWGRHEIMLTARLPLYERKGDQNGYLGYKYKHSFRYTFHYSDRVKIGLTGSQDSGEPFFARQNKFGYDHYTAYALVKKLGPLDVIVVGQYRLSLGMGLVMNGNMSFGKLALLQNLGRGQNTIRGNSSRMEEGYLQGAAATLRLRPDLTVTAYASHRPLDATLDNRGQSAVTLIYTGYHRTPTEMEKKQNLRMTDAGVNVTFRKNGYHLGATMAYTHLSRQLQPNTSSLYRRYNPAGKDFVNGSIDYGYASYRWSAHGETAIDKHGALATVNVLSYRASSALNLMALQRFYSFRYNSLHAESYAEGGHTQNESGLYLGADWHPSRRFQLQGYTDLSYFAFARYMVSQPSYAWDSQLSATYSTRSWIFGARYRLHLRQRDNAKKTALIYRTEHRGRLSAAYQTAAGLTLHTQADLSYTNYKTHDYGYMFSERFSYVWGRLRVDAAAGYFNTTSYESRLYLYERAPLYTFTFPMFYGEGLRSWLLLRGDLNDHWTLLAKIGWTNYFDRDHISSGTQLIRHSSMTDVDVQIRWKI